MRIVATIWDWLASPRTTVLLIALTLVVGIALYAIGIAMDARQKQLAELQTEIDRSRDQVSILEADWAYLSRPDRILHLGVGLLNLAPLTPEQIISEDELVNLWQSNTAPPPNPQSHPVAGDAP